MLATMSLPMSWMSPCTVHSTTVPSFSSAAWAARCGFTLAVMPFMISPAMMSSGMNASPLAKRWPITSMASLHDATIVSGSAPLLRSSSVIRSASSSRSSITASFSSFDIDPPWCGTAGPPGPHDSADAMT